MTWVYGIQSGLFIKVGITHSIRDRLHTMNLYNPHPCKVIARRRVFDLARKVEGRVHKLLASYAIGREWFLIDPPLVRAALTVVVKQVEEEQRAWVQACADRAELKHRKQLQKGLSLDSGGQGHLSH